MTWVINLIVLNLVCHGCFLAAIYKMMKAEEAKKAKASR